MPNRTKQRFSQDQKQLYKKVGLWAYGFIVIFVTGTMIFLLQQEDLSQTDIDPLITDDEIQAVLDAAEGKVSVSLANIEEFLPVKAPVPAWRNHAANWSTSGKNHIAIIIDDLGLDENKSKQLALLDGPLTMAFLPYAEELAFQTATLKRAGHELMVHLPMEPKNKHADPGPNALLGDVGFKEFERRIVWNLDRFDGFVGVNNHMGSALTENPALMVRVMVHLRKNGYLFLDSLTSPKSVGASAAAATGVPYIERDIFLDNERDVTAILAQLSKTERIARQRGYAVAIGHPYDETLKALQFWTAQLDRNTFDLVPVSQLVALKQGAASVAEASAR